MLEFKQANPLILFHKKVKDPGKRRPIWQYNVNERDKICRAYIIAGPYQPTNISYPASGNNNHRRYFQSSWFKKFPSWLEYSPEKDAAYCLPCYLFGKHYGARNDGKNAFSELGFSNWKKVNNEVNCAFVCHEGSIPNSPHNLCVKSCDDLMAQSKHIDKVLDRHSDETIANNRLRLKTSINAIRWLAFQVCAFRGDDESPGSLNRRNFIELIKLLASCNQNVHNVVLENAPGNAQYISPSVQKDILHIFARKLRVAQANNVANLIANDQIVTVLEKSTEEGNFSTRGDASAAYDAITSFEFVFVLHLMRNILEVSHDLCQALQRKNQDILNALTLVSTTKTLIQRMRESSWEAFIKEVILFCEKHEVEVPDMNALHIPRRGRTHKIVDQISVEHHYRVNLFLAVIDTQLQEFNGRFNDNMVELLTLSSTLDPRDNYKFSSVNKVCELVERFYPGDFSDQEKFHIRMQAQHYELDVPNHVELTNLCTISELCQGLTKTGKSLTYPLIDRLIRLVLTLPVSTTITERSFSAMNIVKNRLRNKIEDELLANCL
ncbi:Zinc finger MYM-type protein [Arachis hypogaea]|nr:Zinc finger MYM-type protein [Arachis hypogaea]